MHIKEFERIFTKKQFETIVKTAHLLGWTVTNEKTDGICLEFQRYSLFGRDFSFEISCYKEDGIDKILDSIYEYWEYFDCSYEAYLWLDNSGHGHNGAPYEMIDVYNDMVECEDAIHELWERLRNVFSEIE